MKRTPCRVTPASWIGWASACKLGSGPTVHFRAVPAPSAQLSPRLEAVLADIPDRGLASRMAEVFRAASRAVGRLTDLDLLRYESTVTQESADLSLWEEMAPVVADTVTDVNALLIVLRQTFSPGRPVENLAMLLDRAVAEVSGAPTFEDRVGEAETLFRKVTEEIAEQVTRLGERMRDPAVVGDRWNLLAEIQFFRSRFREQIGMLVFETTSAFADVQRSEVVPGYAEELNSAVAVRAAVADLKRVLENRGDKARVAELEDVQWHAQQLEKEVDVFGQTRAYQALRAQDKRRIIEYRQQLREMAAERMPNRAELVALAVQFLGFVEKLSVVNRRSLLVEYDRALWAASGVKLERAAEFAEPNPTLAAQSLQAAADLSWGLYGRDIRLDDFLRRVKKQPLSELGRVDVATAIEDLRVLLAGLALSD